MKVVGISAKDIDFVLSLEKERIGSSLGREELLQAVQENGYICLVAREDQENESHPCGYILASISSDEAEIYSVAVLSSVEGRGVGRLLVEYLLNRLRELGVKRVLLEVEVGNGRAYNLYRHAGFTEYRRRNDYYGDGGEAICMERRI